MAGAFGGGSTRVLSVCFAWLRLPPAKRNMGFGEVHLARFWLDYAPGITVK
jgi:hypothetical protein